MSRNKVKEESPPSLVHLFEPPEGTRSVFGWVCGYSADDSFMELAVERFSQLTTARRAHMGRIWLALMTDPTNPQIRPADVPGVLHIPFRTRAERAFRLMHAKVALLGFRHDADPHRWCLRLIVSTGNWTRQTIEESLDLAWQMDLDSARLKDPKDVRQSCADIRAAWSFLESLQNLFDARALTDPQGPQGGHRQGETALAMNQISFWAHEASNRAGRASPRFFDNRTNSLLFQLPTMVEKVADLSPRNRLVMGSGFYEAPSGGAKVPVVIQQIVDGLKGQRGGEELLTANPEVTVFVNPQACEAVAEALPAMRERGWIVRAPGKPESLGTARRTLHAKFLFSANYRANSQKCNSAWLYLGSGNLTGPGFTSAAHRERGNLEAGVVIDVVDQTWTTLCDLLPVQWTKDLDGTPDTISTGAPWEEKEPTFFAAPVAYLIRIQRQGRLWLAVSGETDTTHFAVLDLGGSPCEWSSEFGFSWLGPAPRQVRIRWSDAGTERETDVPVVDGWGRIAGATLGKLDVDAAWSQLMNFPLPPPEEELDETPTGSDADDNGNEAKAIVIGAATSTASYPIRSMMVLIENIATLQEQLTPSDWATWCMRLEQTLTLASECEIAQACRGLRVNILSPLRHPEFRPDFARDATCEEGRFYDDALAKVEKAWGVEKFTPIGVVR